MDAEVKSQIKELIIRYAALLDARRRDLVAGCFAPDVHADYDGRIFAGIDDIMAFAPSGTHQLVYHFIGQIDVAEVAGRPSAETHVLSYAVRTSEPSTMLIRGCRWLDDFELVGGHYVMVRTVHRTDWSVEVPTVTYTPSSERMAWEGLGLSGSTG